MIEKKTSPNPDRGSFEGPTTLSQPDPTMFTLWIFTTLTLTATVGLPILNARDRK